MDALDSMAMPLGKYGPKRYPQKPLTVDQVADTDPAYLRWLIGDEGPDLGPWPGLYGHAREALARRG